MFQTRDKRRRSDLDLFVLALIDSGVSTPYELKTAAGLSPGATIPALSRLIKDRFIVQGKPGPRGRTDHRITAEGRRYMQSGWKELIEAGPSGDLDADLRVALLALWVGKDRRLAAGANRQPNGSNPACPLRSPIGCPRVLRSPSGTRSFVRHPPRS